MSYSEWDKHWKEIASDRAFFGKILSIYRNMLISREVKHYTTKYFPKTGVFVECGAGTGESSSKIYELNRTFIALDISVNPLKNAKKNGIYDYCVRGDIFNLPFSKNSVDGIWNVGVMEHFHEDEIVAIFKEFRRILKENSVCVLFWPWRFGPAHLIIEFLEKILSITKRSKVNLFPTEHTLFDRSKIEKLLLDAGFKKFEIHLSPYGGLVHWVVVCWK